EHDVRQQQEFERDEVTRCKRREHQGKVRGVCDAHGRPPPGANGAKIDQRLRWRTPHAAASPRVAAGRTHVEVMVSFTFSTSALSANGFGRKANCSFSGR